MRHWHSIMQAHHHRRSQLQVKVRLNPLLRHRFGNALRRQSFMLIAICKTLTEILRSIAQQYCDAQNHTERQLGRGACLRLAALELARQQVAEPALQQRHDAAQEEQPDAPHGRPEADARPLAHRPRVEAVVHDVLQVCGQAVEHSITRMKVCSSSSARPDSRVGGCIPAHQRTQARCPFNNAEN